MKTFCKWLLILATTLAGKVVMAQQAPPVGPKVIHPSPQAAQLGKFGGYALNHSTGLPSINIPLYTAEEGSLSLPISLAYHYSGCRPADEPGWVGLGWSLVAGGSITRTIKGSGDEINTGKSAKVKALVDGSALDIAKYKELSLTGEWSDESQPDIFSFQFAGYSGKFVFDENGTPKVSSASKILFSFEKSIYGENVLPVITKWTAVAPDGTKYVFGAFEASYSNENANVVFPSAWYVTEITGANGDRITFEYSAKDVNKPRVQVSVLDRFQSNVGTASGRVLKNFSREIFLQKIQGTLWEIAFNSEQYDPGSIENTQSYVRKLNNIQVKTSNGVIRQFNFTFKDINAIKLTLESVGEQGLNPYSFDYYGSVPKDLHGGSRKVDAWGYYNGVNNQTLAPDAGVDLEPRLDNTKIGALRTITYPTKGSTLFEYEQNEYGYLRTQLATKKKLEITEYAFFWLNRQGIVKHNPEKVITLTQNTRLDIKVTAGLTSSSNCTALNTNQYVSVTLSAGSYSGNDLLLLSNFSPCNQVFAPCGEVGDPLCGKFIAPEGFDVTFNVKIFKEVAVAKPSAGGLRLLKMTDMPGNGPNVVKEFFYTMETDPSRSSGVIVQEPVYDITVDVNGPIGALRVLSSASFNPMSLTPVYYKSVREKTAVDETRYWFTSHDNYDDKEGKWSFVEQLEMYPAAGTSLFPSNNNLSLGDLESYDFMRGLPLKTETKDLDGRLKRRIDYAYEMPNSEKFSIVSLYFENLGTATWFKLHFGQATEARYNFFYGKAFYVVGGWARKTSETVTEYNTDGTASQTIRTDLFYSTAHRQLSQTRVSQSDYGTLETTYKYPLDYKDVSNRDGSITTMIDRNILTPVIEKKTIMDRNSQRNVIGAELTTYRVVNGNVPVPNATFGFNASSPVGEGSFPTYGGTSSEMTHTLYRELLRYNIYDSQSNILEVTAKGSDKTSYVWGYNGQYPVAEIRNASASEVDGAIGANGQNRSTFNSQFDEGTLKSWIQNLQGRLGSAQVKGYTYKPGIGVSSIIDPSGRSTNYLYDGVGRLKEIRDNGTNQPLIQSFDYNYADQGSYTGLDVNPGVPAPGNPGLTGGSCNVPTPTINPSSATYTSGGPGVTLTATSCTGTVKWNTGATTTSITVTPSVTTQYDAVCQLNGCDSPKAFATVTVGGTGVLADGCYVIRSKKTNSALEAVTGDFVEQRSANGSLAQTWKVESVGNNQYKITVQDGSGKVMGVGSEGFETRVGVGAYAGNSLQKWTLQSDGNGAYRVSTPGGITWDMKDYGNSPILQLYGGTSEGFADQRLFIFQSTTCGGGGSSLCMESEASPNRTGGDPEPNSTASGGYVTQNYFNPSEYVTYTFNVPTSGSYTFKLWYVSPEAPTAGLIVNSGSVQTFVLPSTGNNWTAIGTATKTVTLQAGVNTIRIQGGSNGSFRQDKACVEGGSSGCTTPAAPGNVSANPATVPSGGGSIQLTASGCSGGTIRWYAGGVEKASGSSVSINVTSTTTYTAKCDMGSGCVSVASSDVTVTVAPPTGTSLCMESEASPDRTGGNPEPNSTASGGYVTQNYFNPSEYVTYTFNVPTSGSYTFKLWYVSPEAPTAGLIVNSGSVQTFVLPSTGNNWTAIGTATKTVTLQAGVNTIRIQGGSNGSFRQDKACVESGSSGCTTPAAPGNVSANPATVPSGGGSIQLTASGCSGGTIRWYAGGVEKASGSSVSINVTSTTTYTAKCDMGGNCISGPSSEVTVTVAPPTGTSLCMESEASSDRTGGNPEANSAASGGYVTLNYSNSSEYVTYTVNVPTSGTYTFKLWYVSPETPTAGLIVNSGSVQTFVLPSTGSNWTTIGTATQTVSLQAGVNTIRVQGGSGGSFRQDKACVEAGGCSVQAPGVSASPSSVTSGGSVQLTATGCNGQVKWFANGQSLNLSGTPATANPTVATTYTATCTENNCESSPSSGVAVSIGAPASCDFNLTSNGNKSLACGAQTTLASCQGADCGGVNYTWQANNDGSGTGNSIYVQGSPGTITYSITAKKSGCADKSVSGIEITTSCGSASCDFTVTPAANQLVKVGSYVVLNASCAGADCNGVTYSWSGQGLTGTTNTNTVSFTAPASVAAFQYTLTVTKPNCTTKTFTTTVTTMGSGPITAGCYAIQGFQSQKYLQTAGIGGQVKQYTATNQSDQVWRVEQVSGQEMRISAANGLYWDVTGASLSDGTILQMNSWNGGNNQKFTISVVSDAYGGYRITPVHAPGSCIEMAGFSIIDGGGAVQSTWAETGNRRWNFVPKGCGVN